MTVYSRATILPATHREDRFKFYLALLAGAALLTFAPVRAIAQDGPEAPAAGQDLPERARVDAGEATEVLGTGFGVVELTPDLAAKTGHQGRQGVLVVDVRPDGAAAKSSRPLKLWDLIIEVAAVPVKDLAEYKAAVAREDFARGTMFRVVDTQGKTRIVLVQTAE
jgi:hypothetical protein